MIRGGPMDVGGVGPDGDDEGPRVNGWTCPRCHETTYCVELDAGVTPMFLACRAEGVEPAEAKCHGTAQSIMYPPPPIPEHVLLAVEWEWYRPLEDELREMVDQAAVAHVQRGGLLLRKLTNAGRAAVGR